MRPPLPLLAGLLLSISSTAGGFEDARFAQGAAFRPDMGAFRAAYQASQAAVAADRQAIVPLPELLNNMRRTPVTFKAGDADVHVFGVKAQNNPGMSGWHIGFAVDGGETVFYKGLDALHARKLGLGPSRHLEIKLNGRLFDLQIKAAVLNWMKTRVVITPKEAGARPIEFTIAELADGVYEAGWPVTLGGREYRLLYTENIIQVMGTEEAPSPPGGVVRISSERVIALMFRDPKNGIAAYGWMERYIPKDQPMITWTVAKGADADGEAGPALSVMINPVGHLDLRYQAPAPSKKK